MWNRPFDLGDRGVLGQRHWHRSLTLFITIWGLLWLLADLLVIGISVIPQCGLGMCPDDPPPGADLGDILGWALVLGLGVVAAVIAYFVERRMSDTSQDHERDPITQ